MIDRCSNPESDSYSNYGGRGIKVCDRWLNSFENFLADMGPKPGPEYSIDRKDNDRDYEPGNCRWATELEQQNNRRNNRWIQGFGRTQTLTQWSIELGIPRKTLSDRLGRGMSLENAAKKYPPLLEGCCFTP
jgi:hypothetical protein